MHHSSNGTLRENFQRMTSRNMHPALLVPSNPPRLLWCVGAQKRGLVPLYLDGIATVFGTHGIAATLGMLAAVGSGALAVACTVAVSGGATMMCSTALAVALTQGTE